MTEPLSPEGTAKRLAEFWEDRYRTQHNTLHSCEDALAESRARVAELEAALAESERRVEELEQGMAYEARVVEAQTLDVKALGKGRRAILTEQVDRMRRVALGDTPRSMIRYGRDWRELVSEDLAASSGEGE